MAGFNGIGWFEIGTGDPDGLRGGLFATEGKMPGYAVLVEDVEAACRRAEQAGGKV